MSLEVPAPAASTLAQSAPATKDQAPMPAPASHAPATTPAPQPGPAVGTGVQALSHLMAGPAPLDPNAVVALIHRYPQDRDAILFRLHSTLGNAFVQQVTAALAGSQAAPPALDGVAQDGGALGASVIVGAANASSHVTLDHPAEAAVTSVGADGRPVFSISARVPFAQIQDSSTASAGITPAQLAQITNVSLMAGPGGAVSYHIDGSAVVLGLSGAMSANQLNATLFKFYLASGLTVAVQVHATAFHTETSEWTRAGDRDSIAQEQREIAIGQASLAAGDGSSAAFVATEQTRLAGDQAKAAADAAPTYVMLDENGVPVAAPAPTAAAAPGAAAAATPEHSPRP